MKIFDRILMKYLRKRGWVVFWLETKYRKCNKGSCWLKLYEEETTKEGTRKWAKAKNKLMRL